MRRAVVVTVVGVAAHQAAGQPGSRAGPGWFKVIQTHGI